MMNEFASIIIITILVHAIGLIVIYLRFRFLDLPEKTEGALLLCATFNNALFLPIPLVLIFVGEQGIPVIAIFSIVQMSISVSIGLAIGSYYGGSHNNWKASVRKAILFPPFIAASIGAIFLIIGFTFPAEISTAISNVNTVTVYLALFVVGMNIGTIPSYTEIMRSIEVVLTRQFLIPAIIFIVLLFSGLPDMTQDVLMIQALMPTAVFIVIYATEFGLDSEAAATAITLGTIVLLPIVPFLPLILS
jgi:predicted permease